MEYLPFDDDDPDDSEEEFDEEGEDEDEEYQEAIAAIRTVLRENTFNLLLDMTRDQRRFIARAKNNNVEVVLGPDPGHEDYGILQGSVRGYLRPPVPLWKRFLPKKFRPLEAAHSVRFDLPDVLFLMLPPETRITLLQEAYEARYWELEEQYDDIRANYFVSEEDRSEKLDAIMERMDELSESYERVAAGLRGRMSNSPPSAYPPSDYD